MIDSECEMDCSFNDVKNGSWRKRWTGSKWKIIGLQEGKVGVQSERLMSQQNG